MVSAMEPARTDDGVPALSVVMPAYNAERYLNRAIDSILNQTFSDLELIIVDDASTDRTWELAKARAAEDARIRVYQNDTNLGVAATTNRGIERASAPLIGRMDADDISVPDRFEKQMRTFAANPHYAVLGTYASHTNEDEQVLSLSATGPASEQEYNELRARGEPTMVFGGTALFRKDLFESVGGFDESLRRAVDFELFDRMSDFGPIVAVPEPLLLYRLHEGSLVRSSFFQGRQIHRFVDARRHAIHSGGKPMSYERYVEWEASRPALARAALRWDDKVQYRYREAGLAFAQGKRGRFAANLLLAGLMNPIWVGRRLWDQRLSPSARKRNR